MEAFLVPLDIENLLRVKLGKISDSEYRAMIIPVYPWQEPYLNAVQETDDAKLPHHLLEATAAVEQRLLSPIDKNSLEYMAIENTRRCIEVLRAERCPSVTNQGSPDTWTEPVVRSGAATGRDD
jgi:hypothetical protein